MEKKFYKPKNDKNSEYFDHKNQFMHDKVKHISILPHPATLESYEEISPGIANKIGGMITKEQEHRHRVEIIKVRSMNNTYRFGQLLSAMLAVTIIYATFLMLEQYQNEYLAGILCVSGFAFLTIINVLSFKRKQQHHFKKKKK